MANTAKEPETIATDVATVADAVTTIAEELEEAVVRKEVDAMQSDVVWDIYEAVVENL